MGSLHFFMLSFLVFICHCYCYIVPNFSYLFAIFLFYIVYEILFILPFFTMLSNALQVSVNSALLLKLKLIPSNIFRFFFIFHELHHTDLVRSSSNLSGTELGSSEIMLSVDITTALSSPIFNYKSTSLVL